VSSDTVPLILGIDDLIPKAARKLILAQLTSFQQTARAHVDIQWDFLAFLSQD
jgi:hypothetical protein